MNKQHILDEIRSTAKANDSVPLGHRRFYSETGIKYSDWHGLYWARWNDAVREAGLLPIEKNEAYSDELLIGKLIALVGAALIGYPLPITLSSDLLIRRRANE